MSDQSDPYNDRPYVPPAPEGSGTEGGTTEHGTDEATPTTAEQPTVEQAYAPPTTPPAADAPPPPAPETPVAAHQEQPIAPDAAASGAPVVPGTQEYAHRYPTAEDIAASAPVAEQAASEPTITFDQTDQFPPVAPAGKPKRRVGRKLVAGVALVALAGGAGYGGAWLQDQQNDDDSGVTSSLTSDEAVNAKLPNGAVEKVAQTVLPSVVQINVRGGQEGGSGTGIIISSDGDILTNNHVVDVAGDGGTITVAFNDGTNASAKIVGTDPVTDIAVIKVSGKSGLQPAELGSSSDLRVGQEVVAIGSPYGLESTVTEGIVSALNRPVSSSDGGSDSKPTIFPAVQTDAAINPGNSGGPLVNLAGQVVGINSAIRAGTTTSGEAGSIGLGFAIPIDLAKNVAKQLLDGKKVEHAQIGVTVQGAVSDDDITGIGARIQEVTSGSAGDKAGLKKGDVITAVDGHAVATNDALVASIRAYQPGQKIELTVQRDGKTTQVEVTLGSDAEQ